MKDVIARQFYDPSTRLPLGLIPIWFNVSMRDSGLIASYRARTEEELGDEGLSILPHRDIQEEVSPGLFLVSDIIDGRELKKSRNCLFVKGFAPKISFDPKNFKVDDIISFIDRIYVQERLHADMLSDIDGIYVEPHAPGLIFTMKNDNAYICTTISLLRDTFYLVHRLTETDSYTYSKNITKVINNQLYEKQILMQDYPWYKIQASKMIREDDPIVNELDNNIIEILNALIKEQSIVVEETVEGFKSAKIYVSLYNNNRFSLALLKLVEMLTENDQGV